MALPVKLSPNDPRVKEEKIEIRGKTYKYLVGQPSGAPKDTIVLLHGFPDLGFGWRYQIPFLLSQGFQVVVPDLLGFGGTDRPAELESYSLKSMSADIAELAQKFVGPEGQIILGGHDWGAALGWRVALWHPKLIKAMFMCGIMYRHPSKRYVDIEQAVAAGHLANFKYQLQFRGPEVEAQIQGPEKIRQFLNAIFGGRTSDGEPAFDSSIGAHFEKLHKVGRTPLMSEEEMDHFVQQFMRQEAPQMRGPLNFYRTNRINFEEELPLAEKPFVLDAPALAVTMERDAALPPHFVEPMIGAAKEHLTNMTWEKIDSNHWVLVEKAAELNACLAKWLGTAVYGQRKASL